MTPKATPTERKVCPKCSDSMHKLDVLTAIPQYIHEGARMFSDKTPAISLSSVFPVEMYMCESCRFVELYAAQGSGLSKFGLRLSSALRLRYRDFLPQ